MVTKVGSVEIEIWGKSAPSMRDLRDTAQERPPPAPPSEVPAGEKLTGRGRRRCGARARSRGGAPCQCKVVPGRTRCKFHGGMSTGPKTPEGKARCVAGAKRYLAERRKESTLG